MRKAPKELVEAGTTFLKLMDALRREFKVRINGSVSVRAELKKIHVVVSFQSLRLLWSRLNDQTAAQDELNMCKIRLRLRFPDEVVTNASPSVGNKSHSRKSKVQKSLASNLSTQIEIIHIIEPHQVHLIGSPNLVFSEISCENK